MTHLSDNRIPADDYTSRDFLAREVRDVWPRVWHVACREQDLPEPGNFFVYDFLNETVLLVRQQDASIKAFHNVCRHRGRQLLEGCGFASVIRCPFHGWRWNTDGSIKEVQDPDGWGGALNGVDLGLKPVACDTWEGFVFINLDVDAEPLASFLDPVPEMFGHYEYGKMRYERYRTYRLDCNWKVALEAFNETYHIAATHTQLLAFMDDRSVTKAFGKHAMVTAPDTGGVRTVGARSQRLGERETVDARAGIAALYKHMSSEFGATYQSRDAEAARRLFAELPETATPTEAILKFIEIRKEVSEALGAGWPEVTSEQLKRGGLIWHIFPNLIINPTFNASIVYRARPHLDDPNQSYFDIIFLRRYAPGFEPDVKKEYFNTPGDDPDPGLIVNQDMANIAFVQKGMRSSGFAAAQPNPGQELTVINFHRVLRDYMAD